MLSSLRSKQTPEETKDIKPTKPDGNDSVALARLKSTTKTKVDFNDFKFIISTIKDETDFIFPCRCRLPAHRCCVSAISIIRKKITCPFCEDYYRFEAKKKSLFSKVNQKALISLICQCTFVVFIIIICVVLIILNVIHIISMMNVDFKSIIFLIIISFIIVLLSYWLCRVIIYQVNMNNSIIRVTALSKDGFEREINRIESK